MDNSIKIGKIFGIRIGLHYSWFLIFIFLSWSLAISYYPIMYPTFTVTQFWLLGIASALLLFVSVLFHELAHSLVAKANKIKVDKINLFFFGGLAEIHDDYDDPKVELKTAAAGPIFSILFGALFYLLYLQNFEPHLSAIFKYLYYVNFILAIFNLVPGYPLDGGRIFRSLVWMHTKDLKKATRIAVVGGKTFAVLLILLGVYEIFISMPGGLWYILIGIFLYFIANASLNQVLIKDTLSKVKVESFIKKKYETAKPDEKLNDIVKRFMDNEEKTYIMQDKNKIYVIDVDEIRKIPRDKWKTKKANDVAKEIKPLSKKDNAYEALMSMSKQGLEIIPVVDEKKIIGIVKRNSIYQILELGGSVDAK